MSGTSGEQIGLLFNIGPRISAQVLGLTYTQYRPVDATNPIVTGNIVGTPPVWITADAKGMGRTPLVYGKPVAFAMIDPVVAQVGDYLIGPFGTFFIISLDGVMPTQVVRCNQTVSVTRPGSAAPSAGYYGGVAVEDQTPLMTAWPASVLQGTKGETGEVKLPGDTKQAWAAILLPSVSGVEILPGDCIATMQGTPMQFTVSSCELTALGWRLSAATAIA